jgi:hypothetical protein
MRRVAGKGLAAIPPAQTRAGHTTRGLAHFLRHNTIALLALFLALGGTSFAAASYISGKQVKPHSIPKNRLTNKAIKQLKGNRGPQGERGPTGAQGIQGPPGPGAIRINGISGQGAQTVGTFGPWTVILGCTVGSPNAKLTVHGPGSIGGTTSIAGGGNPATTYVGGLGPIGAGATVAAVDTGAQVSQTLYVQTGSTLYELKHLLMARTVQGHVVCEVVGGAIPIS